MPYRPPAARIHETVKAPQALVAAPRIKVSDPMILWLS